MLKLLIPFVVNADTGAWLIQRADLLLRPLSAALHPLPHQNRPWAEPEILEKLCRRLSYPISRSIQAD